MSNEMFRIRWPEHFPKINRSPATEEEISKEITVLQRYASDLRTLGVISHRCRTEVANAVAEGITNAPGESVARVNPDGERSTFDEEKGYFTSLIVVAPNQIVMEVHLMRKKGILLLS